ncbi:MAG: ecfE, partial [Francisellaceae bacterium]|nr:ecfE [Francisellaceae bacterium]
KELLKDLGLIPFDPFKPIIDKVLPGGAASQAGLKPNDEIITINKQWVSNRTQVIEIIQNQFQRKMKFEVKRNGKLLTIEVNPHVKTQGNKDIGFIGVEFQQKKWPEALSEIQKLSPVKALQKGFKQTVKYSLLTLGLMKKMILGQVSLKYIGGPISIAEQAGHSVHGGLTHFLSFLALVSISLGVLNLMPIPVLDGGQLLFGLIEFVQNKPLGPKMQQILTWIGVFFLVCFMTVALYNDYKAW